MESRSLKRSLLSVIIIFVINCGSTAQSKPIPNLNTLHKRSLVLLAKYNLNPTNKSSTYIEPETGFILPAKRTFILDTIDSNTQAGAYNNLSFHLLQDASERIGLNLSLYIGKQITRLNYLLKDSSQVNSSISAHVLYSDTNLAGAYLTLDAYGPGIIALNDHSQFKAKNFVFPKFNPALLDTVAILGPWDKSDNGCCWINSVNFLSKEEVSSLAATFSAGKKVNSGLKYWVYDPIEEYAIVLNFKTGERYSPHCIFRNDTAYLNDYKCYYILDRSFMDFVKGIIKSRGVSTCKPAAKKE